MPARSQADPFRRPGGVGRERAHRYAADLTVLSQDVLSVPAADLPATRSLLTLVDGDVAFESPELRASSR